MKKNSNSKFYFLVQQLYGDESYNGQYTFETERTPEAIDHSDFVRKILINRIAGEEGILHRILGNSRLHFFREIWQNNAQIYPNIFLKDELDGMMNITRLTELFVNREILKTDIRIVEDKDYTNGYDYGIADKDGRKYRAFIKNKGSLLIDNIHRYSLSLNQIYHSIADFFLFPITCTAYYTPAVTQTFPLHWDTDDVFIIQLEGFKKWTIYDPIIPEPLEHHRWNKYNYNVGDSILEKTLMPGDVLYVPRGHLHLVRCEESESLHITIGVCVPTWHSIVHSTLEAIMLELGQDINFRQPSGIMYSTDDEKLEPFFSKLKDAITERLNITRMRKEVLELLVRQGYQGSLLIDRKDYNSDSFINSKFSRLPGPFLIEKDEHHTYLKFGGKLITMPPNIELALHLIMAKPNFLIEEIKPFFNDSDCRLLIQNLLDEKIIRQHQ